MLLPGGGEDLRGRVGLVLLAHERCQVHHREGGDARILQRVGSELAQLVDRPALIALGRLALACAP